MSTTKAARREWDHNLEKMGSNCLLWPDFLEWGDVECREIIKKETTDDLGIGSVVVQDPRNKVCFNIIKQIKKGKPASEKVNPYEWIVAVDGKSTTKVKKSEDLVNLIRNGEDTVYMSIRKPINPLENVRVWDKEESVLELNLEHNPEDLGFHLAHFYSKAKNGKVEDRILILKVDSESQKMIINSGQLLIRGDELIAVDDTDVKGKKLKDIYDLIRKPSKPILHIRRILTKEQFEEKLRITAIEAPNKIYWNQLHKVTSILRKANEPIFGFTVTSGKSSTSGETFHVINHVKEESPASHANLRVGDRLMSVNSVSLRNKGKKDAEDLIKGQDGELKLELCPPGGLKECQPGRHSLRRRRKIMKRRSDEYYSSGPDDADSCEQCHPRKQLTKLPENKLLWSINEIEHKSFDEICDLLDKDIPECNDRLARYLGFPPAYIDRIRQQFSPTGGIGAGRVFLDEWSRGCMRNNVEKLRKIFESEDFKRGDIVESIDEWMKKDVCFGGGPLPNLSNNWVSENMKKENDESHSGGSNDADLSSKSSAGSTSEDSDREQHLARIATGEKKNQMCRHTKKMKKENDESYSCGPNGADLCEQCHQQEQLTKLPENKLLWPVDKVERNSLNEICRLLDKNIPNYNSSKLAGYLRLRPGDIDAILQLYSEKGGMGVARACLETWSSESTESNVGEFKKICQGARGDFKRVDVVQKIDEWTEKKVCFGCGRLLK